MFQTAERISHIEESDNVIFQRSLFAYQEAAKMTGKTVLEIGAGMGYGLKFLLPQADQYIVIDKFTSEAVNKAEGEGKIIFHQMTVPPLSGIADNSVDVVVSFQVIEHIKNDKLFLQEIQRVLVPGGKLIITTPNLRMSLTRNPWHVREYTKEELKKLFTLIFNDIKLFGVFGNSKVMDYYEKNKKSVQKFTRFDLLNLQHLLPRFILRIPYDILNRVNRKKLLGKNRQETLEITVNDYFLNEANDRCFDFFAILTK